MIIIDNLQIPYTEQEKNDFIVKYNHCKGYEIIDTENALLAMDYTNQERFEQIKTRINSLKITKLEFVKELQKLGISYAQLKNILAANEKMQMEWDLCVELCRSNQLLDEIAKQIGIDSEQIDNIFYMYNCEGGDKL